jgi:hypothetical protein
LSTTYMSVCLFVCLSVFLISTSTISVRWSVSSFYLHVYFVVFNFIRAFKNLPKKIVRLTSVNFFIYVAVCTVFPNNQIKTSKSLYPVRRTSKGDRVPLIETLSLISVNGKCQFHD